MLVKKKRGTLSLHSLAEYQTKWGSLEITSRVLEQQSFVLFSILFKKGCYVLKEVFRVELFLFSKQLCTLQKKLSQISQC